MTFRDRQPTSSRAFNLIAFQIGWLACVLGASSAYSMAGPVVVAVLLAGQLRAAPDPPTLARWLLLVGALGAAIDTGLGLVGLLSFRPDFTPSWACPPWLFFLWMIFGSTLPNALRWLAATPTLAAVLGATAGPLSYFAGREMDALTLAEPLSTTLLVLAVLWGLLLPTLFGLLRVFMPEPAAPAHSTTPHLDRRQQAP